MYIFKVYNLIILTCRYSWKQWQTLFSWTPKSLQMVTVSIKLRRLLLGRKAMTNLDSILKSRHHFANKGLCSQSYGFSNSRVEMWELRYKEGWAPKNWCFRIAVLEKTHESPLDCKEIKPINPKGIQLWIFFGRTDAEVEVPILWPPDSKSWIIRKDPDAGKEWRQKGMTEDEMVGWHHRLNGNDFEQTPGDGEGQGSLARCSPWGHKVSDTTERLNWTELIQIFLRDISLSRLRRKWSRAEEEEEDCFIR